MKTSSNDKKDFQWKITSVVVHVPINACAVARDGSGDNTGGGGGCGDSRLFLRTPQQAAKSSA